jgi:intracellular septation protein
MTENPAQSPQSSKNAESVQRPQQTVAPSTDQVGKFFLEIGPLVLFFGTYLFWDDIVPEDFPLKGLMAATAVLMVAVPVAVTITYVREKRVPLMPLVTMVMVLIFGGLTLILQDKTFIKMKPTIVNGIFAIALFGGLLFGKGLLKPLFGPVFHLDDDGWKKLSLRWGVYFVFLGIVNEAVWRTQTESTWVYYKVWGVMPLTIVFALAMMPLIVRHTIDEEGNNSEGRSDGEPD